jgi:photosystem II stability/assembly factor-like uncharacterized protein
MAANGQACYYQDNGWNDPTFVLGPRGDVGWSNDHGQSWTPIGDAGDKRNVHAVAYPSERRIIFSGDAGVSVSADSGKTWASGTTFTGIFTAIDCWTDSAGVATTSDGVLYRLTPSFSTWVKCSMDTAIPVYRVRVAAPGIALAVGPNGAIMRTGDRGAHWNRIPFPDEGVASERLNDVNLDASGRAIIVGTNGLVLFSEDGGLTWRREPVPTSRTLRAGIRIDAETAIVAGDSSLILRSPPGPPRVDAVSPALRSFPLDPGVAELYPCPSSGRISIRFKVGASSEVAFSIRDILGREVRREHLGALSPGRFEHSSDLSDLPGGMYCAVLEIGAERRLQTMVIRR